VNSYEISDCLDDLDWTNGQLAAMAAVTPDTVKRWLNGRQVMPAPLAIWLRETTDKWLNIRDEFMKAHMAPAKEVVR
jgi:plasmid maintenance system antidote protein VapI